MTRRPGTALGADALRGLLGAEDLSPVPAPAPEKPPSGATPPKPRKRRVPPRRRTTRRPPSAQRPASEPTIAGAAKPPAGERTATRERAVPSVPGPRTPRTNVQGYIDARVLERARDAAFWTPGVSLSALIERGLRAEIARLEAERGESFPPRRGPLTPGPAVR